MRSSKPEVAKDRVSFVEASCIFSRSADKVTFPEARAQAFPWEDAVNLQVTYITVYVLTH